MLFNDPVLEGLAAKLDVASLRQKVTANNIANLNTPGFKRSYVSFGGELERAKRSLPLERTAPGHAAGSSREALPSVEKESHTSRRADGNNVDLDREMVDMVTNQLRYNTLTQEIAGRYASWRYVINEGRR